MFQNFLVSYLKRHVAIKEARRLSFLRQGVAYALSKATREIPHAAAITHFDVTPLVEYGRTEEDKLAQGDAPYSAENLTKRALRKNYSAFFIKAIAHALHHVPEMNGFLDYGLWRTRGTLYLAEDINVSITVHTNKGVIKPIIRNPHRMTLDEVAREIRTLARKARRTDPERMYRLAARAYLKEAVRECDLGALPALWMWLRSLWLDGSKPDPEFTDIPADQQLSLDDVLGATITIANIGSTFRGHQTVTVIIPPEVAMIGLSDVHCDPGVVDGQVVPRYWMTMCGTIDHRGFDGGEVFPFQKHMARYCEHPELIYEWKPGDDL